MKRTMILLALAWLLIGMSASAEGEMTQTGYTNAVPAAYTIPAERQGAVEALAYSTRDYARNAETPLQKTAYVYLPYGYDESTPYNIVYLMHGWGGHAGEYFDYTGTKNMLDHLIENGDIEPTIFVSATFYNENSDYGFSGSIDEFRAFHLDFENALMPAVEGKYHTYAEGIALEDFAASRDHRAFGGFSLGSVTTWLELCHDADYIRYFLPMSGSCWYYGTYGDFQIERNVDFIEQLVEERDLNERGYFIYHAVGTQDSVKSQSIMMAEEMLARDGAFPPEHYVFYQKDGGYHDLDAVQEYLYNALPLFFRDGAGNMKSILIADTTREERERIVHQALWGACGIDCEFCSGCDNRGGGRIESICQPYIDGLKEIREINAEYNAPFVRE